MSEFSLIEYPDEVARSLAAGVLPLLKDRAGQIWRFSISATFNDDGSMDLADLTYTGPDGRHGGLRAAFYPDWSVQQLTAQQLTAKPTEKP